MLFENEIQEYVYLIPDKRLLYEAMFNVEITQTIRFTQYFK